MIQCVTFVDAFKVSLCTRAQTTMTLFIYATKIVHSHASQIEPGYLRLNMGAWPIRKKKHTYFIYGTHIHMDAHGHNRMHRTHMGEIPQRLPLSFSMCTNGQKWLLCIQTCMQVILM